SAGLAMAFLALVAWYGVPHAQRKTPATTEGTAMGTTKLAKKIDHALIEGRVVLPGSQALLGFQLATILTDSFTSLPVSCEIVHFTAMSCVAISVVLLMFPAAYHRIAERGELSEELYVKAGRAIVGALAFLALGMTGDLYVVTLRLTGNFTASTVTGVL